MSRTANHPTPGQRRSIVKLGMHIPSTAWEGGAGRLGATLAEVVEAAEAVGFDAIAVTDHLWLHPIIGGPEASQIEAYTTLGFIAARTRRARLLTAVTAAPYRDRKSTGLNSSHPSI